MKFMIVFVEHHESGYVEINPQSSGSEFDKIHIEYIYIHPDDLTQMKHSYGTSFVEVIGPTGIKYVFRYKTDKRIPQNFIGLTGCQLDMLKINHTQFEDNLRDPQYYVNHLINKCQLAYFRGIALHNTWIDCVSV